VATAGNSAGDKNRVESDVKHWKQTLRLRELTRPSAQASEILPARGPVMGDDRSSVLALVGDSMDNSKIGCQKWVSDGGVNYTSNREKCCSSRLVFEDPKSKRDSLKEGYIFNLPEHKQWDSNTRGIFTEKYGDVADLIAINVDEQLIQAMVRLWDPAYQCFTFNQEDMTPTIEEYSVLLRIDNVQLNKIYVKEPKPMTFKKKLMKLTGMTDTWAEKQIRKKNEVSCIPWFSLRELVQNHPDILKRVDMFVLAIYGLIVFPKVLGHIEVAVVDFFEKLRQGINPVPTILAETFRSLSSCRRKGEGRFIGCAQLLNAWIFSQFWKVERTPFHMFSKTFTPLEAYLERIGQRMSLNSTRSRFFRTFVPLLGLWGGVGYAPLMVQRQFASRQFILATGGLAQFEFAFTGEGYMKKVRDTANSWRELYLMEEKIKKEEVKAAHAMIELKKKSVTFETISAELMTSQSERQELKGKIRDLKNTLQVHQ
ncbi:hypothetical protein Gotri_027670, partial [Gossypium trilobum]|nr:hypothetical protein [Gossypium trilobum]